jgi:hypothetical protein
MNFFGSEKYFSNRTPNSVRKLEHILDTRKPSEWFLSPNNKQFLTSRLLKEKMHVDEITLYSTMNIWSKKNKIDALYNAEYNSTCNDDHITLLDSINQRFISFMHEKYGRVSTPLENSAYIQQYKNHNFDDEVVVQDGILQATNPYPSEDKFEKKKYTDLSFEDMRNMDVYDPTYDRDLYAQSIGLVMKRSRRNTNIQKYMHKRNTDYDLDGLQTKENDRASLDNMVRGFDMSEFRRNANNSKKPISRYQHQY